MNARLATVTFPVTVDDAATTLGLSRKYTKTLLVKAVRAGELVHLADDTFAVSVVTGVKVCKKDATHGEHRVTKSGSYCYACDRLAADLQKLARNLVRNNAAA